MPPAPTQTAVLALCPPADPVVAQHRAHLDRAARWGVPAHVTVVHPFVPPEEVDDELLRRLATAVATVPAQPYRDLTAAVVAAFPEHPPYAGAFDGSAPHLTVGERRLGDLAALHRAEADVRRALPVRGRVDRVQLLSGTDAADSWTVRRELPLG